MKRNGFTLIELLVVVAIMGIIIGIGIQIYTGIIQKAECSGNAEQHRKVVNLANEILSDGVLQELNCDREIVRKDDSWIVDPITK